MSLRTIKTGFLIAALYDIVLGVVFGLLFKAVYTSFGAELPNHDGYIQLIALYVLTFGVSFLLVNRNPQGNRQIIIPGIMMKASFAIVVFAHLILDGIPLAPIFIALAAIDILFMMFFWLAYSTLNKMATTSPLNSKVS